MAQQNRIIKHNREQGRAKVIVKTRTTEDLCGIAIWNKYALSCFQKIAVVSDVFKVMWG